VGGRTGLTTSGETTATTAAHDDRRDDVAPRVAEPRTHADRVDRWLSLAAGAGAIFAVAVSLYQANLARAQLRASAWPYLGQSNSYVPGQPYTREVTNEGVGPARIRAFTVLVDGKPVRTWGEVVRTLTGAPDSGIVYSSLGRGSVIPPGTARTLLRLPPGVQAARVWSEAQTRLETVICYCSIYDECWEASSERDEPEAVRTCAADSAGAFGD
jgi:hypothetical protein